jgi:hypothetical protein
MIFKKYLFYFFFYLKTNSNENIEGINNYLHLFYPSLKNFYLTNVHLKKTSEAFINNKEVKGVYFHLNDNYPLFVLLKYSNNIKQYLTNILVDIEFYNISIIFEGNYKESIKIKNIIFNKKKNSWLNYIKKQYKYIENYQIHSFDFIKTSSYKIKFNKQEINYLYNNLKTNGDFLFLLYLLDNSESFLNKEVYIFDPFTEKKITLKIFKEIIEKQIYMYICNSLYKEF